MSGFYFYLGGNVMTNTNVATTAVSTVMNASITNRLNDGFVTSGYLDTSGNLILKKKYYKFPGAVVDSKGNKVYIKEAIYSDPATIVFWNDNTKTICKAVEVDTYNPEAGLAICILKKVLGNTAVHDLFKYWCCFDSFEQPVRVNLAQVIKEFKK